MVNGLLGTYFLELALGLLIGLVGFLFLRMIVLMHRIKDGTLVNI